MNAPSFGRTEQRMSIRIAVGQFNELTEEKLRFAAQIGATGIQMNKPDPARRRRAGRRRTCAPWSSRTEAHGLDVRGDRERADALLRQGRCWGCRAATSRSRTTATTIRAVGARRHPGARLPLHAELGLAHRAAGARPRRRRLHRVRHGSWSTPSATAADAAAVPADDASAGRSAMPVFGPDEAVIDAETMWANYAYFIKRRAAGGRGGGREAGAAPRRSAGADARRRRAALPRAGRLQAGLGAQPSGSPAWGARPLPRLLLRDAGRQGQRRAR